AEQFGCDQIAAAASWKQIDRLRVRRRDNEDGQRHQHREEHCQVLMMPEREEGLFWPVARGAQPVGAETDPGEKRDQRKAVKDLGIADVARRSDKNVAQRALVRSLAVRAGNLFEPMVGDVIRVLLRTVPYCNLQMYG